MERKSQEIADIEMVMRLYRSKLDWDRIEEFYDAFDLKEEARRLRGRYGHS